MANWLLDYIEMTEYIPTEFRDQSFLMRELDLKVSIAMNELEQEIKDFFSKIDTLSPQEKQDQYEALLRKCDFATKAASDKVKMADRLHDLVEKSMRLLDQGLEKLKEDLLEGDKAYIVEDLEKRSQELDEQMRLEQETMLQRQHKLRELKTHSKAHGHSNYLNNHNNHRHSLPAHHNNYNHHNITNQGHYHHNRSRNSFTGAHNSTGKQRKRERKRLNNTMTIFNRNSRTDDDSTNQTLLSSPSTPDYLAGLQSSNSNSLNDVSGGDNSSLTIKGMMASNRNPAGMNDKSNGNDPLSRARQPILTAIDAAHAVSPNATNSDKLVLFSCNSNGDNYNGLTHIMGKQNQPTNVSNKNQQLFNSRQSQLGNHLLSSVGFNSGDSTLCSTNSSNHSIATSKSNESLNHDRQNTKVGGPFSTLPLTSRHDPIMMAASQAISATQNMTPGRRTSSLKASYAAVNSGRLQTAQNHSLFDQAPEKIYCKCRGTIHDPMMIACDNDDCKIEWFHYECVGITTPPDGNWYCDDCRILLRSQGQINSSKQSKAGGVTTGQLGNKIG